MANRNSQATKLNSEICKISLTILFTNECCLMNATILRREYILFLVSSSKYSSTPNKEIKQKLLSYSYGSTGWLAWYRITNGSRHWEVFALLIFIAWDICISLTVGSIHTVSIVISFKGA